MACLTASVEAVSLRAFGSVGRPFVFVNDVSEQQAFSWRNTLYHFDKSIDRQYPHIIGIDLS
jgi:hypothetical protein